MLTVEDLLNSVQRICVNECSSTLNGEVRPYLRPDLYELAKQSFEKGEKYFYIKPKDANDPLGDYELGEPEYKCFLDIKFTEEEYEALTKDLVELRKLQKMLHNGKDRN